MESYYFLSEVLFNKDNIDQFYELILEQFNTIRSLIFDRITINREFVDKFIELAFTPNAGSGGYHPDYDLLAFDNCVTEEGVELHELIPLQHCIYQIRIHNCGLTLGSALEIAQTCCADGDLIFTGNGLTEDDRKRIKSCWLLSKRVIV